MLNIKVKTLFEGKTEGEAGKFDKVTLVYPTLFARTSTVVVNIKKVDEVKDIWLLEKKLFGRFNDIWSWYEKYFDRVTSNLAENFDCTVVEPLCTVKIVDLKGIGARSATLLVHLSILTPSDHSEDIGIWVG